MSVKNGTNYNALREQVLQEIRDEWQRVKPQSYPQAEELARKIFERHKHQLSAKTIRRYVKDETGRSIYF